MNPVFMAAVIAHGGTETRIESKSLPGSIPANIRPPRDPATETTTGTTMSLASAGPASFFSGLFSSHASDSADTPPAQSAKAVAAKPTQTASVAAVRPKAQSQPSAPAQSPGQAPAQTEVKSAANAGAAKPPAPQQPADASQPPVATASNTTTLLRGAQAAVPAGSFDSRWSAMH
jgi:hypothetical protein